MSTTHAARSRTLPPPPPVGDPLLGRTAGTTRTAPRPGPRPPAAPATARTPGKRRHPAKGSRAAALVMSIGSTAGLTAYFYQADSSAASGTGAASTATALQPSVVVAPPPSAAGAPQVTIAAPVATVAAVPAATAAPAAPAAPASTAAAPVTNALADGTFIGQTFTNRWGPVQVQVTVSAGQITDVATLQSPGGRSRSIQISNIATPILRTEALRAQSAQIHTVSGATYTSKGYRQSLQSALDVAKAQAGANAG